MIESEIDVPFEKPFNACSKKSAWLPMPDKSKNISDLSLVVKRLNIELSVANGNPVKLMYCNDDVASFAVTISKLTITQLPMREYV